MLKSCNKRVERDNITSKIISGKKLKSRLNEKAKFEKKKKNGRGRNTKQNRNNLNRRQRLEKKDLESNRKAEQINAEEKNGKITKF